MNDYNLRKNAEGYADPTAAATLTRKEPGEVWEYNGTRCLIIKCHGRHSTILQLTDNAHPNNVKVTTCEGVKYTNVQLLTYGFHDKMGGYIDTLSRSDFDNVIAAVEDALSITLEVEEIAEPVERLAAEIEAKNAEIAELRKRLDEVTEELTGARSHMGTMEGLLRLKEADRVTANNAHTKAKNQLELLRDMYNELLAKTWEGVG
jgi:hypothetical protein